MALRALEQRVEAARRFNRFYTRKIGVLHEGAYRSPFSLTEVRVLYELAHRDYATATALGRELGLDAGYLSRILRGFERRGLVLKTRSVADGRQSHLSLTAQGRRVFAPPKARGAGLGTRLVGECLGFARQAGYRKVTLWTQSELSAARRLYKAAGFRVTRREKNHSFGKDLVSETWELDL